MPLSYDLDGVVAPAFARGLVVRVILLRSRRLRLELATEFPRSDNANVLKMSQ
jgi:hypothetical protein